MSYLRQQRALYATVGALAGAALFVDTKARGCLSRRALLARLQAAAARAAAARACGGVSAQRQRDALRRAGRGASLRRRARLMRAVRHAVRHAARVQRLVLRTRAEMEDGWVNPPPTTAPLPVRAAALGSVAATR
jgi:hypothetical protein